MPKNEDLYGFVLCRLLKDDCVIYCADDPTNSFPSGNTYPMQVSSAEVRPEVLQAGTWTGADYQ